MRTELLDGKPVGANGAVPESGWSYTEVFQEYLESHLVKFFPEKKSKLSHDANVQWA